MTRRGARAFAVLYLCAARRVDSSLCAIVICRGYVVVTISYEPSGCLPNGARGHWLVSIGCLDILRVLFGSSCCLFHHLLLLCMDFLEAPFDV